MALDLFYKIEIWILIITICGRLVFPKCSRETSDSVFKNGENKVFCISPLLCLFIKKNVDKTGRIEKMLELNLEKYNSNASIVTSSKWNIVSTILGLRSVIGSLEKLLEIESRREIRNNQEAINTELELVKKEEELTEEDSNTKNKTINLFLDFQRNNAYLEAKDNGKAVTEGKRDLSSNGNTGELTVTSGNTSASADLSETVTMKTIRRINLTNSDSVKPFLVTSEKLRSKESREAKDFNLEMREAKELLNNLLQMSFPMTQTISSSKINKFKKQLESKREQSTTQSKIINILQSTPINNGLVELPGDAKQQTEITQEKSSFVENIKQMDSSKSIKDVFTPSLENFERELISMEHEAETTPITFVSTGKSGTTVKNEDSTVLNKQVAFEITEETTTSKLTDIVQEISTTQVDNEAITGAFLISEPSELHLKLQGTGKDESIEVVSNDPNGTFKGNKDSGRLQIEISIKPNKFTKTQTLAKKSIVDGRITISSDNQLNTNETSNPNSKIKRNNDINNTLKSLYKNIKERYADRNILTSPSSKSVNEVESISLEKRFTTLIPLNMTEENKNSILKRIIKELEKYVENGNRDKLKHVDDEYVKKVRRNDPKKPARNQRFSEGDLILRPIDDGFQQERSTFLRENTKNIASKDDIVKKILDKISQKTTRDIIPRKDLMKIRDLVLKTKASRPIATSQTHFDIPVEAEQTTANSIKMAFHYSKFHGRKQRHLGTDDIIK